MVQKIIQHLLRLNLEQSVFDTAVEDAAKSNDGNNMVAEILNAPSAMKLKGSPFLQFLFNCAAQIRSAIYKKDVSNVAGTEAILQEQLRTVRIFFTESGINTPMRKVFTDAFYAKLEVLEEITSTEEIDQILSFLPETAFRSLTIGSPCVSFEGKLQLALGIMHNDGDGDMTIYSRDFYPGMQVESVNSVQVQSYDPINPQRQDLVTVPLYEPTCLLDLDQNDTQQAARSSLLMQPAILEMVFAILQQEGGEEDSKEQKLRLKTLQTFIIRGLFRMLDILKGEFLEKMSEFQWLDQLIKYLMKHADTESQLTASDLLSSHIHETRLSQLRQTLICSNDLSLSFKEEVKGFVDRPIIKLCTLIDKNFFLLEIKPSDYDAESDYYLFKPVRDFGNRDCCDEAYERKIFRKIRAEGANARIVALSAQDLKVLNKDTITMLDGAELVVTEDAADFETLFVALGELAASNDEKFFGCLKTQWMTVNERDWKIIDSLFDESIPFPKLAEVDNVGKYFQQVQKELGIGKDPE